MAAKSVGEEEMLQMGDRHNAEIEMNSSWSNCGHTLCHEGMKLDSKDTLYASACHTITVLPIWSEVFSQGPSCC